MAKKPTYPVGSKVKIIDPGDKPRNWNIAMLKLVGQTNCISHASLPGYGSYRYTLSGWRWSWRHDDLELLEMPRLDPNKAFKDSKYANR